MLIPNACETNTPEIVTRKNKYPIRWKLYVRNHNKRNDRQRQYTPKIPTNTINDYFSSNYISYASMSMALKLLKSLPVRWVGLLPREVLETLTVSFVCVNVRNLPRKMFPWRLLRHDLLFLIISSRVEHLILMRERYMKCFFMWSTDRLTTSHTR